MIKSFRDYMSLTYPTKGKQKGSAFLADSATATTYEEEPQQSKSQFQSRGRKRERPSKQHSTADKGSAHKDANKCLACGMRHHLKDCLYIGETPDWFTPKDYIMEMVQWRKENDTALQEALRKLKRARTSTAAPRSSQPKLKVSDSAPPDEE